MTECLHLVRKPPFMNSLLKPTFYVFLLFGSLAAIDSLRPKPAPSSAIPPAPKYAPKIQVAVLLDVSNSMDGLIMQAKAQLWNMVSVMGKAQCDNMTPAIEIALYEYGRPGNGAHTGYIKQINGFTGDLDQVSQNLFQLKTDGGDEYCGQVIYTSLTGLNWDTAATSYKVIFIAGNEDFLQGDVSFTKACREAKQKGVIVNTIYCGDKMEGYREHWNLGSECGNGSYTNINQDDKTEDIPTPYDSTLFALNDRLNNTYLTYGYDGAFNFSKQARVDQLNSTMSRSVAAKRVAVKSNSKVYQNASWDLLDAVANDSTYIAKVDLKTLPDSLRNKSRAELQQIVKLTQAERTGIQQSIAALNVKRDAYIVAGKANAAETQTLETEIEKIIREQAIRFNMIIR
jgi:hypothetical protein